ncbi:winged helix DNA-binding protein [Bacteroides sp. 519]|uniref:winged helix DNA-binding protein n=1 Tax=Bacteroides sp. 519 TaxID=2302937 RepID=UPI0013D26240|nr:winged helix DNA-binding protein [Bacteroides sp. 519]NDV59868.1 MarR family transcriptional regulator [Bacteroides sp. 519]
MKSICVMRDIYKAITTFEMGFEKTYGLSLNEAMVLCLLKDTEEGMTSTAIAEQTEMTTSHTSKVIRSIEDKGLIERAVGKVDKRQMYFSLTTIGRDKLNTVSCDAITIPETLRPLLA